MPEDRIRNNVRREGEQTGSTSPPVCCRDLDHDSLTGPGNKDDDEGGAAAFWNMTASSDMRLKDDLEGVELYRSLTASSSPKSEHAGVVFQSPSCLLVHRKDENRLSEKKALMRRE